MNENYSPAYLVAGLVVASILATCCTNASAQNLSGVWKSDQHGYAVVVTQQGDVTQITANEEFAKPGYETIHAGEEVSRGTLRVGRFNGQAIFFHHQISVANCGVPARSFAPFVATLSNDGKRLQGTMTAQDMTGSGCQMRQVSHPTSFTRVDPVKGACPQIAPPRGIQVSSRKLSKLYKGYFSSILSASAQATVLEVFKRANYGYEMYKVLHQQFSILDARKVPPFLETDLPLLNKAVVQNSNNTELTALARTILGQGDRQSALGDMAMCANRIDNAVYALHLYGVDKAACSALVNSRTLQVRGVQVNGVTNGRCEKDIRAIDWKPWAQAGRNQVTLLINPWAAN